jgi:hypothetical protein
VSILPKPFGYYIAEPYGAFSADVAPEPFDPRLHTALWSEEQIRDIVADAARYRFIVNSEETYRDEFFAAEFGLQWGASAEKIGNAIDEAIARGGADE